MAALGLAFGASLAWGGSDFIAGVASRRLGVLSVLVLSQAAGLALLLCLLVASGQPAPPAGAAAVAACAGLAELCGFAALYASLARGPMGIVAPLSSLGAVVPMVVAVGSGERPGALACAGIVLALTGAALAAREPGEAPLRSVAPGAALGLFSALAFGAFFVAMNAAADQGGAVWAVSVNRAASVAVLVGAVLWRRGAGGLRLGGLRAAGAAGVLDAGANALFALALTEGLASTVSVIGSLYPVTTVLLAAVVLHERPARGQALGVLCVLGGVALVGAGS